MRRRNTVAAATAALIMAAVVLAIDAPRAVAQQQNQGTKAQRDACMTDALRLCFWSIPNHQRSEACLKSKRKDLSAACHREVFGYLPDAPRSSQ